MTETDIARPPVRTLLARRPVWTVAAIAAVIHLAVATRFGWHHDEFYYVICGRHPAFGYVDQPPLTPILAALAAALPGGVLPLRILAIAAQVGCIVLTGVLTAELGGGRRAQTLAAAAIAACPVFVGAALLFGTTVLDQLVWVAMFVLVARALRLRTTRAWLAAGLVAGVGLENKDTVAVLLAGLLLGMVLCHRDVLRTKGFWLAGATAVLIAVPNLVWDAQHGWVNLQMDHRLGQEQGGILGSAAQLPLLALVAAGPPLIALYVGGIRWLASAVGRDHRWLLVVAAAAVVIFVLGGGKPYYPAPALAGLFAAGAVRAEAAWSGRIRSQWTRLVAVSGVVALVVGLPVLPARVYSALRPVNDNVIQTYGWPDYVDQVTEAAGTLPPGTPIFAADYGDAGSLTMLAPALAARYPVYSAHNNYGLWGPPAGRPDRVLCVGQFDSAYLHRFWSHVTLIRPITLPDGLANDLVADHGAIYLCQDPRGTWAQLWPSLRHLD